MGLSSLAELCQYYCSLSAYTLQELHLFLAREYGHQVLWTIGGHGRLGRTKTRDQSADLYCKPSYRSSSIDLTSPKTPLLSSRPRERSMDISSSTLRSADFSINGLERYRSRPKYRENDDDHSEDYKRIISRVNDANYITKDAEPMMEYINKSDLSPKSINVINKESLNQVNYLKTFLEINEYISAK